MLADTQPRLDGAQSQRAFDALLRSLAEPGTIRHVDPSMFAAGVPAVAALVLALADVEVSVNVDGDPANPLGRMLAHVTGARTVDVADADIVTLTTPDPDIVARCRRGTALAPELGARLALRVDALHAEPEPGDVALTVSGPGVPGSRRLGIAGVGAEVVAEVIAANRAFPAGIDTWLVTDAGAVAALSRSTRIAIEETSWARAARASKLDNEGATMSGNHRGPATIDPRGRS